MKVLGYFAIGEENLTTIYTQLNETFVNKDLGDYKEGIDIGREVDIQFSFLLIIFFIYMYKYILSSLVSSHFC